MASASPLSTSASALSHVSDSTNQSPIHSMSRPTFKLFHRRWLFLLLFAMVALFNNLICFTFAPIADQSYRLYGTSFPLDMLITVFFIGYCITTFPASRFIQVMGLRNGVLLGAWLQAIGCGIRCLSIQDGGLVGEIYMLLTGQIIASMGQGFFLNPPPMFASTWFGDTERALATSIACNANSLGIAAAYIIAPLIVKDKRDIPTLLQIIAIISTGLAIIVTFLFEEAPPSPPSYSAFTKPAPNSPFSQINYDLQKQEEKLDDEDAAFEFSDDEEDEIEDNGVEFKYIKDVFVDKKIFSTSKILLADYGFLSTMFAFAVAEACVNGFSTFMNDFLIPEGFTSKYVSLMGSLFIISAMVGSSIASYLVDKYKCFKLIVILSFLSSIGSLFLFRLFVNSGNHSMIVGLILAIGFFIGPIQPIVVEIAAECTYPISEATSAGMLQFAANIASASIIPLISLFRRMFYIYDSMYLLIGLIGLCCLYTFTISYKYKRMEHESLESDINTNLIP